MVEVSITPAAVITAWLCVIAIALKVSSFLNKYQTPGLPVLRCVATAYIPFGGSSLS